MSGKVYFIGAGPGDPGLLTIKGKEIIEKADVIIYAGSLVNKEILSFARKEATIIDSAPITLKEISDAFISAAHKGDLVARVHTGDPSMYGAIAEQMELLQKANIPYEVVPGVSSVFAAAASLKMEYTLPGLTQTLILTRRAGRTPVPEKESIASLAMHRASMAIFLSIGMIDKTVEELIDGGYLKSTPVAVVCRASWPDEKQIKGTLETIAEKVKCEGIIKQAMILVGDAVAGYMGEPSCLYSSDFAHEFRPEKESKKAGTAVIALTRRGWHTGMKILHAMDRAELFLPVRFKQEVKDSRVSFYENTKQEVARLFQYYSDIVLIMATGIAVRIVAPCLKSKWKDPAVACMDDSGRNIISLLSGHWGGANELARKLSQILGGNPVITTESDVMGFPSIDMIAKVVKAKVPSVKRTLFKEIQTAILEDEDVGFFPKELRSYPDMEGHSNLHFFDSVERMALSSCVAALIVSPNQHYSIPSHKKILVIHPRILVVGIGCHKGIKPEEINEGIAIVFKDKNLSMSSIAMICTIDQKKDEKGLTDYARFRKVPVNYYLRDEINKVKVPSHASKHSLRIMGVHGVAEPCAILGAGGGRLIVQKIKLRHMTVAVAEISLIRIMEDSEV